jgi:hypothetical protein
MSLSAAIDSQLMRVLTQVHNCWASRSVASGSVKAMMHHLRWGGFSINRPFLHFADKSSTTS